MVRPRNYANIRMNREIRLVISDFDGTLVDTKRANYLAYRDVLRETGYELTSREYDECFGLRFEEFMHRLGISDSALMKQIQAKKALTYTGYFPQIKINQNLVHFIAGFKQSGGKTALASTAARHNLLNVIEYTGLENLFDMVISGDEISRPKPDPECYIQAMKRFSVQPYECLIFEDAPVGVAAASASGANYIVVKEPFYGN